MQARVQGGGGKGPGPPPPRNWKAKKKKKGHQSKFEPFYLYFASFLVENIIFSGTFWAAPPPEKLKSKKKKFIFWAPPPFTNSWTRAWYANRSIRW